MEGSVANAMSQCARYCWRAINPDAWRWYSAKVGNDQCLIVGRLPKPNSFYCCNNKSANFGS